MTHILLYAITYYVISLALGIAIAKWIIRDAFDREFMVLMAFLGFSIPFFVIYFINESAKYVSNKL